MAKTALPAQVEEARRLFCRVRLTGYLTDPATYFEQFKQLFSEIRKFLLTESEIPSPELPVQPAERGAGGYVGRLIRIFLEIEQGREYCHWAPNLGREVPEPWVLAYAQWRDTDFDKIGTIYLCQRRVIYSSVYSALLALILDDWSIRRECRELEHLLQRCAVNASLSPDPRGRLRIILECWRGPFPIPIVLYRGQPKADPPIPSALRNSPQRSLLKELMSGFLEGKRRLSVRRQLRSAIKKAGKLGDRKLTWEEWEGLFQHFGIPTLMLDMTTDLRVAAFFATRRTRLDNVGVIFRFHPVRVYMDRLFAHFIMTGYVTAGLKNAFLVNDIARSIADKAATVASRVRIVTLPYIERIKRQKAVFIGLTKERVGALRWGPGDTGLEPVCFRQWPALSYEEPEDGISEAQLFPADDPLLQLADPVLKRFGYRAR